VFLALSVVRCVRCCRLCRVSWGQCVGVLGSFLWVGVWLVCVCGLGIPLVGWVLILWMRKWWTGACTCSSLPHDWLRVFCIIAGDLWKLTHHARVSSRLIRRNCEKSNNDSKMGDDRRVAAPNTETVSYIMYHKQTMNICSTVTLYSSELDDTYRSRCLFYQKNCTFLKVCITS